MNRHRFAREIFASALAAVDPRKAVSEAIATDGPVVEVCGERLDASAGPVYAIAIGKAAASMARGLEDAIGDRLAGGVITAPVFSEPLGYPQRWQVFAGGHPLPNEASLAAAQSAFALLDRVNAERGSVIFLVSGGGSAMIEWPISDDVSLADLRRMNEVLVASGARISEINAVRRGFSAVKGGGLARRAPNARLVTLIVSDTNSGDEATVASGPTLPPPPDAFDVIAHYHLEHELPKIVKSVKPIIAHPYHVLLDNSTALEAARAKAVQLGLKPVIRTDICEQPIQEGCDLLLASLNADCLISGGEFSCPVRGDGRGGRNLETVLRCAIGPGERSAVVLSAGTDGIDGNSPAAGAIAGESTIERARNLGLDAADFLARSDSYTFFEKLNDLIVTGPTGTNVRDLRILIR